MWNKQSLNRVVIYIFFLKLISLIVKIIKFYSRSKQFLEYRMSHLNTISLFIFFIYISIRGILFVQFFKFEDASDHPISSFFSYTIILLNN